MSQTANLTPRQSEIYEFIKTSILTKGIPPTVREIGEKFKIKSPNGVVCHMKALCKKGLISRTENISRGIELMDRPQRKTELKLAGVIDPNGGKMKEGAKSIDFVDVLGIGDRFVFEASKDGPGGIKKGDCLVCKKQQFYRSGSTVVVTVLKNTFVATIKDHKNEEIILETLDGMVIKPTPVSKDNQDIQVEGLVMSLIRRSF